MATADVVIKIDVRDGEAKRKLTALEARLNRLNKAGNSASGSVGDLGDELDRATDSADKFNTELDRNERSSRKSSRASKGALKELRSLGNAFSPLIKFDLKFNKQGLVGNFEIRKDKTLNLNITGPQILETKGQEYIIGFGYRYPKFKIKSITIQGKPLESDLNFKLDLSFRKNLTITRRIVPVSDQITAGQNIITLKTSLDYQLTSNINLRLFYDWIRNKPQTSQSFPTANTNAGFSLRFNLQ